MVKVNEITLGASLKQHRVSKGLSVRAAATNAGITPMYLSLLERNACGPPSDEKLQSLAEALGEPHVENFFAKAGRVTPRVVNTILRHPTSWSEFIEAAKGLDADHLAGLKAMAESGQLFHFIEAAKGLDADHLAGLKAMAESRQLTHFAGHGKAEGIAEPLVANEESQPKHILKGKCLVARKSEPPRPKQRLLVLPDVAKK
jgi:transcriptional regulator with XRE-family HTH domain